MNKLLGLFGRIGHVSRDYALQDVVSCAVTTCPANRNERCSVPALIKIRADAKCQTGVDFLTEKEKNEKQKKRN